MCQIQQHHIPLKIEVPQKLFSLAGCHLLLWMSVTNFLSHNSMFPVTINIRILKMAIFLLPFPVSPDQILSSLFLPFFKWLLYYTPTPLTLTLKMEAACSTKMLAFTCRTTQYHDPEYHSMKSHCHKNLKSYVLYFVALLIATKCCSFVNFPFSFPLI
jgi:hypothetical protein